MADLSKISIPSGTLYIKDSSAVASITVSGSNLNGTLRNGNTFSVTIPDTKQSVVSTASKTYLTGVTTAPTTTAQSLTAAANSSVYATDGQLNGHEIRVAEKVKQQYNTTTESLDFIFE